MNRKNYDYVPSNAPIKDIFKACKQEALKASRRRIEKYKFKYGEGVTVDKKGVRYKVRIGSSSHNHSTYDDDYRYNNSYGNSANLLRLSYEMEMNAETRLLQYKNNGNSSIWTDGVHSKIAAPLGSHLYLKNDKVGSLFGAPVYYMDKIGSSDDNDINGRHRFPYSSKAHRAATVIKLFIHKKHRKKVNSCIIIQKNYRRYRILIILRQKIDEAYLASNRIKFFYRKVRYKMQQIQVNARIVYSAVVAIQSMVRCRLAHAKVHRYKLKRISRYVYRIQRMFRRYVYKKKQLRRKHRRLNLCCTKIIRLVRGYLVRIKMHHMKVAKILIVAAFREYFSRRYTMYVLRIQRHQRIRRLYRKARSIQTLIRKFIGKCRYQRHRLHIISSESVRRGKELAVIRQVLLDCSYNYTWCGVNDINDSIIVDHMDRVDEVCSKILDGTAYSKFIVESKGMTYTQRLVCSILFAVSNRPNACVDYHALEVAKEYLVIKDKHLTWEKLLQVPMHNVVNLALSNVLEASYTLSLRVNIKGRLPDKLLMQAVLTRRWTKQANEDLIRGIIKYRRENAPRRTCKRCYEPLLYDHEVSTHSICNRNHLCSWIKKDAFIENRSALLLRCTDMVSYPKLINRRYKRSSGSDTIIYIEEEDEDVDYLDMIKLPEEKKKKKKEKNEKMANKGTNSVDSNKSSSRGVSPSEEVPVLNPYPSNRPMRVPTRAPPPGPPPGRK